MSTSEAKRWSATHSQRFATLLSEIEAELSVALQAEITVHGVANKIKIKPFDERSFVVIALSDSKDSLESRYKAIAGEYKSLSELELKRDDLVDIEAMTFESSSEMRSCDRCHNQIKMRYGGHYYCKCGYTGRAKCAHLWFGLEINLKTGTISNEHGEIAKIKFQ